MHMLHDKLKYLFAFCLTHGIYIDDVDKESKIIKISVPLSSFQDTSGIALACAFRDVFMEFFNDYDVLGKVRECYWSDKDSERYFTENVDLVYNELNRIIKAGNN